MNKKNEARKNIEGKYTLEIHGNTVSVSDNNGLTWMSRCAPEDKFDISEGVNIALSRMAKEKVEIAVGDMVKIINPYCIYSTYSNWVYKNVDSQLKCQYKYDEMPKGNEKYKVIAIAPHERQSEINLAYIMMVDFFPHSCYLVDVTNLRKVN